MSNILFTFIIFFSAFLLFQIQPMLTKELLPVFGGGASIWTASLCFYQTALLVGYGYAHFLSRWPLQVQVALHICLLIVAASITFAKPELYGMTILSPALGVILELAYQVGLVFVLLSATSVLLQRWYCDVTDNAVPYHWYAWSNLGSLLALLSYPFIIESRFGLAQQKQGWWYMILGLVLVFAVLAQKLVKQAIGIPPEQRPNTLASLYTKITTRHLAWIALSTCSTLCLVATTQMMSTNIPPMPLLWVIPLALYLLTFIVAFAIGIRTAQFTWQVPLAFAVLAGAMMYFLGSKFNALAQIAMYSLVLVICCFFCHSKLRELAPEKTNMTWFYFCIALGGSLASMLGALVAPLLFNQVLEYPLALLFTLLLFALLRIKQVQSPWLTIAPIVFTLVLSCGFLWLHAQFNRFTIDADRNFYGYIAVKDIQTDLIQERRLVDGTTIHGSELLNRPLIQAQDYFHGNTGIGITLQTLKSFGPLNVGVVGLGAGVMAQYGDQYDSFHFYEINPSVYKMAATHFSYLQRAKAKVRVTIADGRIALEEETHSGSPAMNALVIDAFSSDIIPAHLLTFEAFQVYWQRLQDNGVLILHISNNYIDLMPVLTAHSRTFNKSIALFEHQGNDLGSLNSTWAIMTNDSKFLKALASVPHRLIPPPASDEQSVVWTDDNHSVLPLLKL